MGITQWRSHEVKWKDGRTGGRNSKSVDRQLNPKRPEAGFNLLFIFHKQGCRLIDAGLGYIDEYPYLLGKASCAYLISDTCDLHGVPDTNVVNIGCHYFDWHYSNAGGDGNLFPADLTGDKIANLKDFAVLAGYWQQSTLEKNDIDRNGFVDYNDLEILAYQWLRTAIVNPTIDVNVVGDGNNGFVEVGASGYASDTQRIFLYVDGQYAGEIFGFWNGDALGIDVSKLGGGERQFKAVGVDGAGQITCSNITTAEFACPLNYCFLPENYEPNKPLCFSAFNPSAEDVTVNVYADCENLVWSQTYSGNSFWGTIPAEITRQYEFDYISFDTGGGEMLIAGAGGMEAMDAGGAGSVMKITSADPVEPPSGVKALIIATDWGCVYYGFTSGSIWRVQAAFEERGINYVNLFLGNATYDKIKDFAENVKYMYVFAHGNYQLEQNGVLRTVVYLSSGPAVSMKRSDFADPNNEAPFKCVSLNKPGGKFWEEMTDSIYSMGFINLEFAYFDTCYSGRLTIDANNQLIEGQRMQIGFLEELHSDMSEALWMHESIFENKAYQGWYDKCINRMWPWWPWETHFQKWTEDMWWRLGAGDTLGEALMVTMSQQTWSSEPNAPINSFRFKGAGDITNIKLE